MRFRPDSAELGVGFIDENQRFGECVEDSAEPFEDDVRLAEPLAADILQDEDDHIEFAGDRLEDEGFSAADRPGDRRA